MRASSEYSAGSAWKQRKIGLYLCERSGSGAAYELSVRCALWSELDVFGS